MAKDNKDAFSKYNKCCYNCFFSKPRYFPLKPLRNPYYWETLYDYYCKVNKVTVAHEYAKRYSCRKFRNKNSNLVPEVELNNPWGSKIKKRWREVSFISLASLIVAILSLLHALKII